VKLLAFAAALVCVLTAAVAAPALSPAPYRPEAVEFELAPDPDAILGRPAASGGFISEPVRPGKRFNAVGMRWPGEEEPGIAVRTRKNGGAWARWTTIHAQEGDGPDPGRGEPAVRGVSAPLWVGEADQVQYRMTRRVRGLRLIFLNVRGTASAADRAKTALRRAVNSATVSVASFFDGDARAQQPQPAIVPRADWGGGDCHPRSAPDYGVVKAAFVHHTVTANHYTREEAPDAVRAICLYHRNHQGWNDIGYNFLVDKYGTLYEGRAGGIDQAVIGAQAQGYNAQTTGIASIGDHTSVEQTPEALNAIARLIRWKLPLHGAPTSGYTTLVSAGGSSNRYPAGARVRAQRVLGHRDTGATACPGDALYDQLPQLRSLVGSVAPLGQGTRVEARLSRGRVRYKGRATFSGRLVDVNYAPLSGRAIAVQVRRGNGWRTIRNLVTGADGEFSLGLRPHRNRLVRAYFAGGGGLLPAGSPRLLLQVRPTLELIDPPDTGSKRVRVRLRGTVVPRKRLLRQVLQLRRRGRWRTVGVKFLASSRGRFRGSFVPAGRGRYRYYVVAPADLSTAQGRSHRQEITIGS
jgi:hypothetical protein